MTPIDTHKAEQALRVIDAIEQHTRGSLVRLTLLGAGPFDVISGEAIHRGATLLDALAQWAQALVLSDTPPDDPAADLEAFDRATGEVSA